MKRVVITGRGVVSPLGHNPHTLFHEVRAGRSKIQKLPQLAETPGLKCHVGSVIDDLNERAIPRQFRRTMGRVAILAAFAAKQAVEDAGLSESALAEPNVGIAMGSTIGAPEIFEQFFTDFVRHGGYEHVEATLFMKVMGHTVAANTAAYLGISGKLLALSSACASSTQAIGAGFEAIRNGTDRVMVCGGAENVHPSTAMVFDVVAAASRGYNDRPEMTPRPFDRDRDGLALSDGAGVVVLEEYESAVQRSATIHGEILGYATAVTPQHMAQPNVDHMAVCMRQAIERAGVAPTDIQYVNAHATGTLAGDTCEAQAIASVLGDGVPVSSSKGHLGHTLAACGAIELILCTEMARHNTILPTRNLVHIAPECIGIDHVQKVREQAIDVMLTSNFAFGGVGASLVLGRR